MPVLLRISQAVWDSYGSSSLEVVIHITLIWLVKKTHFNYLVLSVPTMPFLVKPLCYKARLNFCSLNTGEALSWAGVFLYSSLMLQPA